MSNISLTQVEYMELLDAREQLYRLEGAGVDNWEGYSIALENFKPKSEIYKEAQEFLNDLSVETEIDYPAGREAGHQVIFNDSAINMIVELMESKNGKD